MWLKLISKLHTHKCNGVDGLGPNIIKHCDEFIVPAIISIINKCIEYNILPLSLKKVREIPIFK